MNGQFKWLDGWIGLMKGATPKKEITAIIKAVEDAKEEMSYSNYHNGQFDKIIKLLKQEQGKIKDGQSY